MTPAKRVVVAAVLSLALHGLVVSGDWVPLPASPVEPQPLTARLVPLPRTVSPPAPKPRVQAPRRTAPAPTPDVPVVASASPLVVPDPLPDAAPAPAVAEEATAPEPPQQLALAAETSAAAARSLPRRGRINYSLYYGEDRTYVGKVVQSWEVEDGLYLISSDAETAGIVELFRPQRLRYLSKGHITREGLRPDTFLMSRTRRGRHEAAQARFDWNESSLAYGLAREPKRAPLAPGAQDFLSFIYQYVVLPPAPGQFRVPITTGARFEQVDVEVGAEEFIETPLGTLRALPVRQVPQPGRESIQIWLAAEYRYLPVRLRHYDR
ncbi:MAG: DUF3108 domain-containing protein, partial [Betaproteobacteria bacterium]|nr:DUF3108 domain-containing protein [Betaproteobacteria bacterium]